MKTENCISSAANRRRKKEFRLKCYGRDVELVRNINVLTVLGATVVRRKQTLHRTTLKKYNSTKYNPHPQRAQKTPRKVANLAHGKQFSLLISWFTTTQENV